MNHTNKTTLFIFFVVLTPAAQAMGCCCPRWLAECCCPQNLIDALLDKCLGIDNKKGSHEEVIEQSASPMSPDGMEKTLQAVIAKNTPQPIIPEQKSTEKKEEVEGDNRV